MRIESLLPLPVAIPLIVAAFIGALHKLLPRRALEILSLACCAAVSWVCARLLVASFNGEIVHWMSGWNPRGSVALGIAFAVDPVNAGLALLACLLTLSAFLYTWSYFESGEGLFYVLMLAFLASMIGFLYAGDIFTQFVFFELMGVASYALTAHKVEESSLEGGLNYGVVNSMGAFLLLTGIGLIYGRTGALNLAQLSASLAKGPHDSLLLFGFCLIATGYLIKAALVPYHFWIADAHAVAPTPVCVLFSGVMVPLGVYATVRVLWAAFAPALHADMPAVSNVLFVLGALTILVCGAACYLQRHLKRLLAFSTACHMGIAILGIALLRGSALGGTFYYVMAHGLVKATLFLCAGMLLHRFQDLDEFRLRGKGRELKIEAAMYFLAALGLMGFPGFGTLRGKSGIEDAASHLGLHWLPWALLLASGITGAAVLRAGARIFLGWGSDAGPEATGPTEKEESETVAGHTRTPATMLAAPGFLLLLAVCLGFVPKLPQYAEGAGEAFINTKSYFDALMHGSVQPISIPDSSPISRSTWLYLALTLVVAFGMATVSLRSAPTRDSKLAAWINAIHSGHVGDYATWMALGLAGSGAYLVLAALR